ncbi:Peptidyl-prolyl cis-trans isomerase ESS1 [Durusdinium trenchii]
MAACDRRQLLAARRAGSCSEAEILPKTRTVHELLQSQRDLVVGCEPLATKKVAATNPDHAKGMHTPPRQSTRKMISGVTTTLAETPEKPRHPRHHSQTQQTHQKSSWPDDFPKNVHQQSQMNADAMEFMPGSCVMPPFIPSVNHKFWVPSMPVPMPMPPMLCSMEMHGTALDEISGPLGMDNVWELSTLSTYLTASESSPKDEVVDDDTVEDLAEGRLLKLTSCLLRILMQPSVLQTSDLMKIIEHQLGEVHGSGPWLQRDLKKVCFSCSDLALLDTRLCALLQRLPPEVLLKLPKQCKLNLSWDHTGTKWSFKEPPELRRLIRKQTSRSSSHFTITSQRFCMSVQLDQIRLKGGVACLHGLDSTNPEVAATLTGKGYGRCCAQGDTEATTIIWDRGLWTFCGSHESGSFLAVDLKSKEKVVRVAGIRPSLEHCCDASFGDFLRDDCLPVVVCADLSLVGGTSSAGLVPVLLGLHSAMFEILGHEVSVPQPGTGAFPQPSGIFFRGVAPVAALSGYTEGYLATCDPGMLNFQTNFPEGQAFLLAEFSWGASEPNTLGG